MLVAGDDDVIEASEKDEGESSTKVVTLASIGRVTYCFMSLV